MHPPHILPSVLIRLADSSLKGSKCPPWINYRSAMLLPHVALSSEISFGKSKISRIDIIEKRGRLSLQNRFCSNDWVHNQYVANDQKLDISLICGYIPNSAHEELTLRPQFRSVGRCPKEDLKTEDVPLGVAVTPSSPLTHLKPLVVTHSRLTLLVSGGSLALVSLRERAGSHWSRAASGGFALLGRICGAVAGVAGHPPVCQ